MIRKKKSETAGVEQAVSQSVSYEVTIANMAKRSERRAWWVAAASLLMSLALAGGYYFMLPLKEKVPFMVLADANTGNATLVRMQADQSYTDYTSSEVLARSYISRYIQARESYDYELLRLKDFREAYLLSSPEIVGEYAKRMQDTDSPRHPDKVYGRGRSVRIRIVSIQFNGYNYDTQTFGATVRFQRSLFDKAQNTTTYDSEGQIASLTYRYNPELNLSDADAVVNPLGFQVVSYRVDTDYSVTTAPDSPLPFARQISQQQAAAAPAQPVAPTDPAAAGTTDPQLQTPESMASPQAAPANPEAEPAAPSNPAGAPAAPAQPTNPPQSATTTGDGAN